VRVLTVPNEFLRRVAAPLARLDGESSAKIREMLSTLARLKGAGLAAPQVGWDARVFVTPGRAYLNPRILAAAGTSIGEEGCLSIPGVVGRVDRASFVRLEYWDLSGRQHTDTLHGLAARVAQHEIDHLDGILFTDRMGA